MTKFDASCLSLSSKQIVDIKFGPKWVWKRKSRNLIALLLLGEIDFDLSFKVSDIWLGLGYDYGDIGDRSHSM